MKGSRATAQGVKLVAAAIWGALMFTTVGAQPTQSQHTVDPEIQGVVKQFAKAVDNRGVAAVAAFYSPEFVNERAADDGGFARVNRAQMLALLNPPQRGGVPEILSIPTRETVIHHAEVIGDLAFVLMTRVKDLGNGWEPMYYSLVWRKRDGRWELLREFVHQRSTPKFR